MTKAPARIVDTMLVKVIKKDNPFTEGTKQHKRATAVFAANGKPVADAKKKGADQWTVRYLVQAKLVAVATAD